MSAVPGPAAKTERLLNLVMCLLYTRRPLPKARLRQLVPQYAAATSDESFDRMFERDKDELRELGIPLVIEDINGVWDDDTGYRIHRREYALPDVSFTREELAVLGLAGRAWAQGSLAGEAAAAIRKLQADGIERDEDSLVGIEPRLRTSEPGFDHVRRAVTTSTPLTFDYRRPGGDTVTRRVQPWGMASWHGRWYLTAYDLDREDQRVFRLSRISGPVRTSGRPGSYAVPADHDARAVVAASVADSTEATHTAVLRVRQGRGNALRLRAHAAHDVDGGWTRLQLDYGDVDALADEVTGFGADVVVEEPPELVDGVVRRLTGVAAAHGGDR